MKKAVFFDIDGTLWDHDMMIPDSTREAIQRLRENDIYTFICSGRAPAFITNPKLLALGFDGIVAGCGTCIRLGNEQIVYVTIAESQMRETLKILKKYDMPVILEGRDYLYGDAEDFVGDPFFKHLKEELGENLLSIKENEGNWEVSKFSAVVEGREYKKAIGELSHWYDFLVHGTEVAEGVPKGFSKASGIKAVCERLGIAQEDTYAFGDSVNDLEMLRSAGHGIAMGNGTLVAKEAADYVTDSIYEDGIYNACKYFSLI